MPQEASMRRTPLLLGIALVVSLSGSAVYGASTQNVTLSATIAEATWTTFDPDTRNGEFSSVVVAREGGVTTATLSRSVGEIVLCEGGDTPSTDDDSYGYVGTEVNGTGPATMTVGRQYRSATAKGTISAEVVTYDECSGDFGTTTTKTIKVSLALSGVGPIGRLSSRSTLRVPGELSAHQVIRGVQRQGAGSVKIGSVVFDADGAIGQLTLRAHETSH
jgi:hypothetical protein